MASNNPPPSPPPSHPDTLFGRIMESGWNKLYWAWLESGDKRYYRNSKGLLDEHRRLQRRYIVDGSIEDVVRYYKPLLEWQRRFDPGDHVPAMFKEGAIVLIANEPYHLPERPRLERILFIGKLYQRAREYTFYRESLVKWEDFFPPHSPQQVRSPRRLDEVPSCNKIWV